MDNSLRCAVDLNPLHIPHPAEVQGTRAVATGFLYLDHNTPEYHCPVVGIIHGGLDFEALHIL